MHQIELLNVDSVIVYDNDIDEAIHNACIKFNIENLKKEGQRPWKAVLQFVGLSVFPDKSLLKSKELNKYNNNNILTNCNRYNYELINKLCDYFIYLSNIYSKFVSTEAFSYFINIPKDTIDNWKHSEINSVSFRIWKKLQDIRLESIKDDALDNGNVTGTMFVGNTEYGLNLPGVSREEAKNKPLSLEDIQSALKQLSNLSTRDRQNE